MKNMIEEKSNCDVFCHNLISKNKISKKKIKLFFWAFISQSRI